MIPGRVSGHIRPNSVQTFAVTQDDSDGKTPASYDIRDSRISIIPSLFSVKIERVISSGRAGHAEMVRDPSPAAAGSG